jgi:hypothetical protein
VYSPDPGGGERGHPEGRGRLPFSLHTPTSYDPEWFTIRIPGVEVESHPFSHTDKTPYKFNHLSWKSYRVQMGDLIAHWRGGLGAEDVLLWPCWNDSYKASFMRAWQAQCADSKHHQHRRDGRYIDLYSHFDAQHFASMSAGVTIYLMFITLMPRRMEGSERDCLIPKLPEGRGSEHNKGEVQTRRRSDGIKDRPVGKENQGLKRGEKNSARHQSGTEGTEMRQKSGWKLR